MSNPDAADSNELNQGHTLKRYDGELSHLHELLLVMGRLVLGQLRDALAALKDRDVALAHRVITRDRDIDRLEVEADHEIVDVIARRAPVGRDLRRVMAVSKSVSDLERMGDEAARIAGAVIQLFGPESGGDPNTALVRAVNGMSALAMSGLESAVDLFEAWSEDKARAVIATYRAMDEQFQTDLRHLMTYVMEDARNVGFAISVVLVIKSLERIGHHAQNLAEYAIFQEKGEDIRSQAP
jgi:phosphate transport system protein